MDEPRATVPKISPAQWGWVGLILAITVASIAFWWLRGDDRLRETSALFIGLPAMLAIAIAVSEPARSRTGAIFKGATLFLLLLGPVLQEGFICVLMMSPIYYAIVAIVAWLVHTISRGSQGGKLNAFVLVPLFAALSLESAGGPLSFPNEGLVTASRIIEAPPARVGAALARGLRFDAPLPWFLSLGFPRPLSSAGEGLEPGSRRTILFSMPEGAGVTFRVVSSELHSKGGVLLLRHESNSTPVERWLRLESAEVRWIELAPNRTRLEWTLAFTRRLAPAWYFHPLEVYGVGQAAEYLTRTLDLR